MVRNAVCAACTQPIVDRSNGANRKYQHHHHYEWVGEWHASIPPYVVIDKQYMEVNKRSFKCLSAGGSESPAAALSFGQIFYHVPRQAGHRRQDQLTDPLTPLNRKCLIAMIDQDDFDFAAIV